MRYVIRTFLGMFLFAVCWVAIGYGLYQMLQIGTCASGGPYAVARECPDGTTAIFFALFGGIIGMFVAAGIYATRGKPPGSASAPNNGAVIVWFWTGIFWSIAVGGFLGVWGPEANPGPGGKEGGLIVAFMGLIMGAGGFLGITLGKRQKRGLIGTAVSPALRATASAASRFTPTANPVERIDTLDRLRSQGTLTDAEFETLKNKIVRED